MRDFRAPALGSDWTPAIAPAAASFTPPAGAPYPVGGIVWYIGDGPLSNLEAGWLFLDGSQHLEADYPELAARVNNLFEPAFGAASPGHFRLPNMRGRMVITPDAITFLTGQIGGAKDHTLTVGEIPSHRHTGTITTAAGGTSGPTDGVPAHNSTPAAGQPWQSSLVGGGLAHNNMPPYLVVQAYVRALP